MSSSSSKASVARQRWFAAGDINGFFGLMVDNLAVMGFLAAVLVGIYKMPADVVFGRMFPGTALGVLVGDLLYTWMAVRLARRTGRDTVTAMPLGIDHTDYDRSGFPGAGPGLCCFQTARAGRTRRRHCHLTARHGRHDGHGRV